MTNNQLLCRRITINKSLAGSQYSAYYNPIWLLKSRQGINLPVPPRHSHINIAVVNIKQDKALFYDSLLLSNYISRFAIKRGCA